MYEFLLCFGCVCVCVCLCVCVCVSVCVSLCACSITQSCLTLCGPMDCSLPGSSVHGIFQARILEQLAISYSRGSSDPGIEPTYLVFPALAGGFFTTLPSGQHLYFGY